MALLFVLFLPLAPPRPALAAAPDSPRATHAEAAAPQAVPPPGPAAETPPGEPAPAIDPRRLAEEQLEALETGPLQEMLSELNQTWAGYAPELRLREIIRLYTGGEGSLWQPEALFRGLVHYLLREVLANSGLLVRLLVMAMLAALLQNLSGAFAHEGAARVAQLVVYLVLTLMVLSGFRLAVGAAQAVMEQLQSFLLALLPTLLTVLVAMGGVTSAAILQPVYPALLAAVVGVVTRVVFPLIFLSVVLEIASGLNERLKVTQLAGLLRQGALVTMGLMFTIFMGFSTVKAAAGAVGDSVAMRTAKYLTGSLVPVVGKMFADATELVWSSGILLKNGLGLLGLVAIFLITIFPCLKILSLVLVYRATAALVQPVGQGAVAASLNAVASSLILIGGTVGVVAMMFFLSVAVLVGVGNVAVMMR